MAIEMSRDELIKLLRKTRRLVDQYVSIKDNNREDITKAIAWLEDEENAKTDFMAEKMWILR